MLFALLLIIWTWGLTPFWVNLTITIVYGLLLVCEIIVKIIAKVVEYKETGEINVDFSLFKTE